MRYIAIMYQYIQVQLSVSGRVSWEAEGSWMQKKCSYKATAAPAESLLLLNPPWCATTNGKNLLL